MDFSLLYEIKESERMPLRVCYIGEAYLKLHFEINEPEDGFETVIRYEINLSP